MRIGVLLALVTCALFAPGCGRRASVLNAQSASPSWTLPKAGDTADYIIATSVQTVPGLTPGTPTATQGRRKVTVSKATNHGRTIPASIEQDIEVKEEIAQTLGVLSKSSTVITWLGIDGQGNAYLLGESLDGVTWDVVTDSNPPQYMPATVSPGSSWSYCAHFASGNTESCTNSCTGTENITTPAGSFQAVKVDVTWSRTGMRGADVSLRGNKWLARELPYVLEIKTESNMASKVASMQFQAHSEETLQSFSHGR